MLSTCALMVDSLSPDCLSQVSKPSRIGWFAPCITWTHCSYDSASSASVMQPLSFRSAILLSLVSPSRQDRLAILVFLTLLFVLKQDYRRGEIAPLDACQVTLMGYTCVITCAKARTSASFTKGIEDESISLTFRTATNAPRFHIPAHEPCGLHYPRAPLHLALPRLLGGESPSASHRQRNGRPYRQYPALDRCHRCLLLPASGLPGHVAAGHAARALARHHLGGAVPGWLDTLGRAHGPRRPTCSSTSSATCSAPCSSASCWVGCASSPHGLPGPLPSPVRSPSSSFPCILSSSRTCSNI